jgi:hypothetical protein
VEHGPHDCAGAELRLLSEATSVTDMIAIAKVRHDATRDMAIDVSAQE